MNRLLRRLTSPISTVSALGMTAFVISFNSLRGLAADTGAISASIAFLFPILVDGSIVALSRSAMASSLKGRKAGYKMALVFMFTALSVVLNIVHSPPDIVSRVIGATAPIALALLIEVVVRDARHDAIERGIVSSIEDKQAELDDIIAKFQEASIEVKRLLDEHTRLTSEVDNLTTGRQELTDIIAQLTNERDKLKRSVQSYRRRNKQDDTNSDIVALARHIADANPGWTHTQIGDKIGRSARTVGRYLNSNGNDNP